MARDFAAIGTDLWQEPSIRGLEPYDQRTYLLAYTQPLLNRCGVTPFHLGRWASVARKDTPAKLRASLLRLCASRHLAVDWDTDELFVRTYIRHDGLLRKPNMVVALVRDFPTIYSDSLRVAVLTELRRIWHLHVDDKERRGLRAVLGEPSDNTQREAIPTGLTEPFAAVIAHGLVEPFEDTFPEPLPERFAHTLGIKPGEPPEEPSPSRAQAPVSLLTTPTPTPSRPANAGTLVKFWIDLHEQRPPERVVGTTAKLVEGLLEEGFPVDVVREGLRLLRAKALNPATLPSLVNEVINKPRGRSNDFAQLAEELRGEAS